MRHSNSRRGVSLFQLLILIAVLAILLGMLLPAIAQVRRAAARMASSNNLKQIGLALHNYHSTYDKFPPGITQQGFSSMTLLLPYIEQDNLYRLIDLTKPVSAEANAAVRNVRIKVLLSPLDGEPVGEGGPTNYLFNAGSKPDLKDNDGLFFTESKVRIADITDGTSNTVAVAETLRGDGAAKAIAVARQHVTLKADALKGIKPEAGVEDWKNDKNIAGNRCSAWLEGRFLQGTFTGTRTLNDDRPDVDCGGLGGLSGMRTTDSVVLVVFADGSVRGISPTLKFATWQAVCTRAGGEVINFD
jgi:type II secretory pathway pseudopilin PulG